MDETMVAFATAAGAFAATFLSILIFGAKLWRGVSRLLKGNGKIGALLGDAMGEDISVDTDVDGSAARHHTGSFQSIVRQEIRPVSTTLDLLHDDVRELRAEVESNTETTAKNTEMISDLSRSHSAVARRTAEHSAKLNIAAAEDTMTNGKVGK